MDAVPSSDRRCKVSVFFKELFYGFVTEYETPKIVAIHSYTMTILLRILQIVLLLYSIFYLFLNEKGYQKQDSSIISSVTLKVKGIGHSRTANNETFTFDGSDYIVPPSENNAIFIMTNFIQTDQVRTKCRESPSVSEAICTKHSDCQNKPYNPNINGRWTGRCIMRPKVNQFNAENTTKNQTTGLCELQGWCPVQDDRQVATFIEEVGNFTIFIKNFIEFPAFHVKHKNMVEHLKPCIFHPVEEKDCPIFRLDYILNEAEKDDHERGLMLRLGGVIRVKIDWDCNLDRSIKLCKPVYSFARLDTKFQEEKFSLGFNFRFSSNWKYNRRYLRALTKAYGLRLIICVSGKAGKFDFITLTLNTGSLIGIFGMATFFCDIILLNLTKKASLYRDFVYQRVNIDASRSNSVSQRIQNRNENVGAIFENPLTNEEKFSLPIWTSETFVSFADKRCTTSTYDFVNSTDSSRRQPSLGLTNILK
ncbi:unnamed protein product [Rotaria socialis]|uniref:P2X purinoceptor n=2 Tax=Rotaria socialis TaxID=392032 RepID=A0A821EE34_9BILA|nr:unnamed protein product [Rotaria socialis]CAF3429600.1 unnamed protein product [Rotaria socialis]CAF3721202.1 unnamed protein product [Rotaria socialis]CAF4199613.1 unnamed protein product [Rotaria socialis]CAF4228923.1 unnamed protein product [Rotaria socialis]